MKIQPEDIPDEIIELDDDVAVAELNAGGVHGGDLEALEALEGKNVFINFTTGVHTLGLLHNIRGNRFEVGNHGSFDWAHVKNFREM